jgi:hypothetical protein
MEPKSIAAIFWDAAQTASAGERVAYMVKWSNKGVPAPEQAGRKR